MSPIVEKTIMNKPITKKETKIDNQLLSIPQMTSSIDNPSDLLPPKLRLKKNFNGKKF